MTIHFDNKVCDEVLWEPHLTTKALIDLNSLCGKSFTLLDTVMSKKILHYDPTQTTCKDCLNHPKFLFYTIAWNLKE